MLSLDKYILYKTKGGQPELIEIFYKSFVKSIKTRFEQNLSFINRCLDEFYRTQSTPLRETQFCVEQVRKIKLKLDKLENIDLPRFLTHLIKLQKTGEVQKVREKYKVRDLKELKGLGHLFKAFPDYLDQKLQCLSYSRIFDKMDYSSFFFDKNGKNLFIQYITI